MESGDNSKEFHIVGIGASAGGLDAFKEFFSGMPEGEEPDMAFVLVQHLAPDHKSALTDIIKRHVAMEVLEVKDGMTVKPGKTYIIPPNQNMTLKKNRLNLIETSPIRGQDMPIDIFFRSLAREQEEKAIGIILSGTGSDGTLGARAIKGQGGMIMVQSPKSAQYAGMPRSAKDTGLIDYTLSPAEMPVKLKSYLSHDITKVDQLSHYEDKLKQVFIILRNQCGHDFSHYKTSTILRRIQHRMSVQQISNLDRYIQYLKQNTGEAEKLFKNLLIGVTSFFREEEAFEVLVDEVIPKLFDDKQEKEYLRIWVPGCATGEEAYSLAIIIAEYQEKLHQNFKVQIFATDIDSKAIDMARRGIFPGSITADVSSHRLSRFFEKVGEEVHYRIKTRIRDMVIFSEQNLIEDPPFSSLDLISCRNLLIYMKKDLQKKVLSLFRYALRQGGYLFLGSSETLREASSYFSGVDEKWKIYRLKENYQGTRDMVEDNFLPPMTEGSDIGQTFSASSEVSKKLTLQEITENKLLEQYVSPAVLVNGRGQVFYIHGRTGLFLEPAPGHVGYNNIINMAKEGLRSEFINALHKASQNQEKVFRPHITFEKKNETTSVNLTIYPIINEANSKFKDMLYLMVLEEAEHSEKDQSTEIYDLYDLSVEEEKTAESKLKKIIKKLRKKLQSKEESLQNTLEELRTTNEELKSSNEELQSTNEELQSTNEELTTSKEELQSLNEELKTVNAELESKLEELQQNNTDMKNLLSGTSIGTIFVDLDLNILRFTPTAVDFVNLIASDIGRPVDDITSNLKNYDNLSQDIQEVLNTLNPQEIEVKTQEDRWHIMRIHPYRSENNEVRGASVTFRDIEEKKKYENALKRAPKQLTDQFMTVAHEPVLMLNVDLKIAAANNAFCKLFHTSASELQGKSLFGVADGNWDIPEVRQLLEDVVDRNAVIKGYELSFDLPEIEADTIKINARSIYSASSSRELIVLTCKNLTGRGNNNEK